MGTLLPCWWKCKLVQPLWRIVWRFLKKLKVTTWVCSYIFSVVNTTALHSQWLVASANMEESQIWGTNCKLYLDFWLPGGLQPQSPHCPVVNCTLMWCYNCASTTWKVRWAPQTCSLNLSFSPALQTSFLTDYLILISSLTHSIVILNSYVQTTNSHLSSKIFSNSCFLCSWSSTKQSNTEHCNLSFLRLLCQPHVHRTVHPVQSYSCSVLFLKNQNIVDLQFSVSDIQRSGSVIHMYLFFFRFFSLIGYYKMLSMVPYVIH